MRHIERHRSNYTPAQLFDLVVDVERYPDFLPWVIAAKVFRRKGSTMWTDLTMGAGPLQKRFTTVAQLDRPHRVEISSHDAMFECFEQQWTFEAVKDGGTDIEYRVDVEFKSHVLQLLIGAAFLEKSRTMVKAYMVEAKRLYRE